MRRGKDSKGCFTSVLRATGWADHKGPDRLYHKVPTAIPTLQTRRRRCFAASLVGAESTDQPLELGFEDGVVGLPAPEIRGEAGADLAGLAALPSEEVAIQVERDQRQHFLAPLFHELRLLLERTVDLTIDPPAPERCFGRAEQHFVPKPDASINSFMDVVAGQELMFVKPTANTLTLQLIREPLGKAFVSVTVRDEAAVEVDRLAAQQRRQVVDQPVWQANAAQEGKRQRTRTLQGADVD